MSLFALANVLGCASAAGTEPERANEKPALAGAWRAEQLGTSNLLLLEADGSYRELGTVGPLKLVASGRWTSDGTTLQLEQKSNESVGMGETRKETVEGPRIRRIVSLSAQALVLEEHGYKDLSAVERVREERRYARLPEAEARALFPAVPTAAEKKTQDSAELAALRAEVERLTQEARKPSADLIRGLAYNDALREARRKAAALDAPDLLRATIALKHRGVEEMDACSMLAEALYAACNYGSLRALEVLVEAGMRDCGMITADAAREARAAGHEAAAKLLEAGAAGGANAAQPVGEQPRGVVELQRAAKSGDYAMVKAWLDQGVGVDVLDRSDRMQRTALMTAALGGHLEVVKLLVARGADVEAMDAQADNAFILAERSSPEIHKWLLAQAGEEVPAAEPVKSAKIDFGKDPSKLDPGALIDPDAPPPSAVRAEPASTRASNTATPRRKAADEPSGIPMPLGGKPSSEQCAQMRKQMAEVRAGAADDFVESLGISRASYIQQQESSYRSMCP